MNLRIIPLVTVSFLCAFAPVRAADWLQFRGPGGLGIAGDKNLPTTWGPQQNVAWKTELPGAGSSSPIVVGAKIYLTCYSGYGLDSSQPGDMDKLKRHLVCLSRDGKILWTKDVPTLLPETPYSSYMTNHGYASSTPVSDGKNVYAFFGKSGVFAFDLDGKKLWSASVGKQIHGWGSGTSTVLYKDLLIINAAVECGAIVALNKNTGKEAWTGKLENGYTWNTPLLVEVPGGRTEVVVNQYQRLQGFDPETGVELWHCRGLDDYVCPTPVAHKGIVYVIGARAGAAIAVRAGGKGDVTNTHLLWTLKKGSNVSSPVYHEGHLYWAHEKRGIAYCANADTGKLVYEETLDPPAGLIYASPLVGAGKLYYVSRENGAYVLEARPKFKLLAHNNLGDASVFNASPAVDRGQLLLRSDRFLYCLGK